VTQDKYARGLVSILNLLDAQNQAFVANQNATIAVYTYLTDIINMQRAISWFEIEQSEAAKDRGFRIFSAFLDSGYIKGRGTGVFQAP
jgi:outer membrane protein TolC